MVVSQYEIENFVITRTLSGAVDKSQFFLWPAIEEFNANVLPSTGNS